MSEFLSHYATDHARSRAFERLGFEPSMRDWRDAALAILDTVAGGQRQAMLMRAKCDGLEVWHVHLGNRQARVVWSPVRAQIVTVLG